MEFNEVGLTTAYPILPFVTTKLLCSGSYSIITIAVFGAEASDSEAVRLIHQRRSETTQALLPTPPDSYRKNVEESQHNQFTSQPISHAQTQASSNYQQYSGSSSKNNYVYGNNDPSSYQSQSFESRHLPDRHTDSFPTRHRPREGFQGRGGLLPTPASGKEQYNQQQQPSSEPYQFHRYQHLDAEGNFHPRDRNWNEESSYSSDKINTTSEQFDESKDQVIMCLTIIVIFI